MILWFITTPLNTILNQKTDTEIHSRFNKYGKHLKFITFNFIYTKYLEENSQLRIKSEILAQISSHSFHAMSLLIFLNSFKQDTCSVLSFTEYEFCLALIETLFDKEYFNIAYDPLLTSGFIQILNDYAEYLLMLNAFSLGTTVN